MTWTPFWWESNACWGAVRSPADWRVMVERYRGTGTYAEAAKQMLDVGRLATWEHPNTALEPDADGLPSIGLRREHADGRRFREWARERGMEEALSLVVPP